MCFVNKRTSVLALATVTVMMLLPEALSFEISVTVIDCTSELFQRNKDFAATNGSLRADIAMNGTTHIYENSNSKEKWLYYTGEYDLNVYGSLVPNISQVQKIIFDYSYRWKSKIYCLQMERVSCN
uniref:Uncharacterized protein n=1 Tax=Coptotermes formosanus TaxID=36987 RepID=R4V355_COPFO|nr:hypothetical protein [Coptotermes formosanus]